MPGTVRSTAAERQAWKVKWSNVYVFPSAIISLSLALDLHQHQYSTTTYFDSFEDVCKDYGVGLKLAECLAQFPLMFLGKMLVPSLTRLQEGQCTHFNPYNYWTKLHSGPYWNGYSFFAWTILGFPFFWLNIYHERTQFSDSLVSYFPARLFFFSQDFFLFCSSYFFYKHYPEFSIDHA